MSRVFTTRMPAGVRGVVSRQDQATIEPFVHDSTNPVTLYGVPVKTEGGKALPIQDSDVGTEVIGFSAKPYPMQESVSNEDFGVATPPTTQLLDVLRRGYITVKNNKGTPAKRGQVYVRITNGSTEYPIGGVEAELDSPAEQVAVPGAYFMGAADASGNVEIEYNI